MQRFGCSHLIYIGCCAFLVVFAYVLFDLLDIAGSNFDQSFGTCTVAEERAACEEAGRHSVLKLSPPWLLPRFDRGAFRCSAPTLTHRIPQSILLSSRPRATLHGRGQASTQPDSDPAGAIES